MSRWSCCALLATPLVLLGCHYSPRTAPAACRISAARSSLAWQFAAGATGVQGVVLSAHAAEPLRHADVRVEPGAYHASTDSAGRFQLSLPRGAFLVRIRALGYAEAQDSLALPGLDGFALVAVLAQRTPELLGCSD